MSFSTEEGWQFVLFLYLDAEPKYLIAVKPIQINEVKKYCKGNTSLNKTYWWCSLWLLIVEKKKKKRWYLFSGKVELEKPLNLVVGPVTPSSVLLSWGDTLKNPYTGNILKECLEEGWVWPSTHVPAAAQPADHTEKCSHQTNNRLSANDASTGVLQWHTNSLKMFQVIGVPFLFEKPKSLCKARFVNMCCICVPLICQCRHTWVQVCIKLYLRHAKEPDT